MNRSTVIAVALVALTINSAQAQEPHQPYAGLEDRPVKALSAQQIDDLQEGRGMGLALPAELNGYPGPVHVLELADRLNLSAAQRASVEELHAAMKAEAIPLGERVLAEERHLDGLFATKTVTPDSLERAARAIGTLQGTLRAAHLKYHLFTVEVLRPEQVKAYAELRGYSGEAAPPTHGGGGHGGAHRH